MTTMHLISCIGSNDPYDRFKDMSPGPVLKTAIHISSQYPQNKMIVHLVKDPGLKFGPKHIDNVADALTDHLQNAHQALKSVKIWDPGDFDVNDFKSCYSAFEAISTKILHEAGPEDPLVVHISSGVPAMQSAWLMLAGTGQLPARLVRSIPTDFRKGRLNADVETVDISGIQDTVFIKHPPLGSITGAKPASRPMPDIQSIGSMAGPIWLGNSLAVQKILLKVQQISSEDISVLLAGESGVGKTVLAKKIHANSIRSAGNFIEVNCGILGNNSNTQIAALFGHQPGYFTDVTQEREGYLRKANNGTLFLDQIELLSLETQGMLLNALENKRGEDASGQNWESDFRLICGTNVDLEEYVRTKKFREDLHYRIDELLIFIPPLRDRREDIKPLVDFYLDHFNKHMNKNAKLSKESYAALLSYDWPGNIRKLIKEIKLALTLSTDGELVEPEDFRFFEPRPYSDNTAELPPITIPPADENGFSVNLLEHLDDIKRAYLTEAVKRTDGNRTKAAKLLGLSSPTLSKWLDKKHVS